MPHHLSRLLRHRLPLPAASSPHAAAAAAFSTSSKRTYARRPKPPPAEPAASTRDDATVASLAAEAEAKAAWQRETLPGDLPRPPTIPFQPRVANAIRLVGTVGAPVQMQRMPNGRFSAVSVLVQDRLGLPKFWIPIIFQDDLAQIAASHLQENDLVSVSGQLTGDVPPFKPTDGQANIQVLANHLSFVDSKSVEMDALLDEDEEPTEVVEVEKKVEAKKASSKFPPGTVSGYRNKTDKLNKLWNDVIARPQDWIDNRPQKKNGSRSTKYPDLKNKVSDEALWLDSAPASVLQKLDDLVFATGYAAGKKDSPFVNDRTGSSTRKSPDASAMSKQKLEEDLWRDLMENPANWWDNRTDKPTPKYPDFKNKDSGQALWISTKSPRWAIDALPSLKFVNGGSKGTRKQTLLS